MGKRPEAGTPKAIANAQKSKGLQKLRFFCQLCQKQCRDENGFKCHTMSESHQRQMLLCADNPGHLGKITAEFSSDFLGAFLRILRLSYNGKRVKANTVYQEYIADKNHTHMNATRWHTLSGFVQWLGKTGYAKIDYVEEKNQWYIEYIDNSAETLQRKMETEKLAKSRKDDHEREQFDIAAMVERGKERAKKKGIDIDEGSKATELVRGEDDAPIKVSLKSSDNRLKPSGGAMLVKTSNPLSRPNPFKLKSGETKSKGEFKVPASIRNPDKPDKAKTDRKLTAMEQIKLNEERAKAQAQIRRREDLKRMGIDPDMKPLEGGAPEKKKSKSEKPKKETLKWIHKKIVVKVMNKKLGEKFYKKKAFIESTDGFVATVNVIENGKRAKVDQEDLETVIPSKGRPVVILTGPNRGDVADLTKLDADKFAAVVELDGKEVSFPYEDISKLYQK